MSDGDSTCESTQHRTAHKHIQAQFVISLPCPLPCCCPHCCCSPVPCGFGPSSPHSYTRVTCQAPQGTSEAAAEKQAHGHSEKDRHSEERQADKQTNRQNMVVGMHMFHCCRCHRVRSMTLSLAPRQQWAARKAATAHSAKDPPHAAMRNDCGGSPTETHCRLAAVMRLTHDNPR